MSKMKIRKKITPESTLFHNEMRTRSRWGRASAAGRTEHLFIKIYECDYIFIASLFLSLSLSPAPSPYNNDDRRQRFSNFLRLSWSRMPYSRWILLLCVIEQIDVHVTSYPFQIVYRFQKGYTIDSSQTSIATPIRDMLIFPIFFPFHEHVSYRQIAELQMCKQTMDVIFTVGSVFVWAVSEGDFFVSSNTQTHIYQLTPKIICIWKQPNQLCVWFIETLFCSAFWISL